MKKRIIIFANWALVTLSIFVIACDTSDMEESVPRNVTRIEVTPAENNLEVGSQLKFNAVAFDQHDQPIDGLWLDWGSSSEALASISNIGLVSALAAGETTISASSGGVSGRALLSITAPDPEASRISNLVVNETEVILAIGRTKTLECLVYDQHETQLSDMPINWHSSDYSVVTIDPEGKLRGIKAGSAKVQASVGKHRTEVLVTISENSSVATAIEVHPNSISKSRGEIANFTAKVYDQYGSIMEEAKVDWISNDACAVSIDAYGNATALSAGEAQVEARIGNISSEGNIRVSHSSVPRPASISGTWIACSAAPEGYFMTLEVNQIAGSDAVTARITDSNGHHRDATGTFANSVLSLKWETIEQGKVVVNFIRGAVPVDQYLLEGVLVGGPNVTDIRISRALR